MGLKRITKSDKQSTDSDSSKISLDRCDARDNLQRMSWKLKYELINSDQFTNGMKENKAEVSGDEELDSDKKPENKAKPVKQKTTLIAGLSGYLSSSDSDGGDPSDNEVDINSEVQAFLKEVASIKVDNKGFPVDDKVNKEEVKRTPRTSEGEALDKQQQTMREYYAAHGYSMPTTSWQECHDPGSGCSYYWNTETNEVRWETPDEYQTYLTTVKKQWEDYHRALYLGQYQNNLALQSRSSTTGHQNASTPYYDISSKTKSTGTGITRSLAPENAEPATITSSAKKKRSSLSDSEDEKIELITSYEPNSDDPSSEDEKILEMPDMKGKKHLNRSGRLVNYRDDNYSDQEASYVNNKLSYVPDKGPPGVDEDPEDIEKQEEVKRRLASRQEDMKKMLAMKKEKALKSKKSHSDSSKVESGKKLVSENEVTNELQPVRVELNAKTNENKPEPSSNIDEPDPREAELVERLKSQAEVLTKLGGELPESVTRIISEQCSGDKDDNSRLSLVTGFDQYDNSSSEDDEGSKSDSKLSQSSDSKESIGANYEAGDKVKFDNVKPLVASDDGLFKNGTKSSVGSMQLVNEITKPGGQNDSAENSLDVKSTEPSVENSSGEVKKEFDIKECSELLLDKMMFLSSGKEPPSPIQIWVEQLVILYKAWESSCLKTEFMLGWLQSLDKHLGHLERSIVPPGWLSGWDRKEKRYYYNNEETNEVSWQLPKVEKTSKLESGSSSEEGSGEEPMDLGETEMDLCTTPPPAPSPPPPPVISDRSPSPPSPPCISFPSKERDNWRDAPPLPDDTLPPLPEEAPPPLPEDAPPLPLDETPPLPPGEPLPPGVEPASLPPYSSPVPVPPPPSSSTPSHRALLPDPPTPALPEYPRIQPVLPNPSHFHHLAYQQMLYASHSQYTSTFVSAAPQPAPPKPSEPEKKDLSLELNSFYSDLASLEPEPEEPQEVPPVTEEEDTSTPPEPPLTSTSPDPSISKKRKKPKLGPGLAMKQKKVSSLVAKWQKVQQSARRDF